MTEDHYKIHVLAHPARSQEQKAKLFFALYLIDEENHRWVEGGETLGNGSYTSTGIWNTGIKKVQKGKIIMRVEKFTHDGNVSTPVEGCNVIEKDFDFRSNKNPSQKPRAKS